MSTEIELHVEQGATTELNRRLINHSHLGLLFPEFIPQLIVPVGPEFSKGYKFPYDRNFPVERSRGFTWHELSSDYFINLTTHIQI